jgi:hypothetical protein
MQSARPPRCWSQLLLLKHGTISAEQRSPRLPLAKDSGRYSRLVYEKRTRFLEHLVEFFGGHFSD